VGEAPIVHREFVILSDLTSIHSNEFEATARRESEKNV